MKIMLLPVTQILYSIEPTQKEQLQTSHKYVRLTSVEENVSSWVYCTVSLQFIIRKIKPAPEELQ